MTSFTSDQIRHLQSYSIYLEKSNHSLFTLKTLLSGKETVDLLKLIAWRSGSPSQPVAASFFMRRYGMFVAMQLYQITAFDECWKGDAKDLIFGATEEFGLQTISMFVQQEDWMFIDANRKQMMNDIWRQTAEVIKQLRYATSISPLTLWENVFGFLLWHYAVLLDNPATSSQAFEDLQLLKDPTTWAGVSEKSLFATYLKGAEPKNLLQTTVRTTCCFSKDVPGLIQCGYCPLKNR